MILAWRRIRQQLARTPGMLAYTTGMANLTEFYTLTLWEKEIDMTLFMASDDHREMMWNVRHWSESFWSMRWNPTMDEVGIWCGKAYARDDGDAPAKPRYVGPGYLELSEVPEISQLDQNLPQYPQIGNWRVAQLPAPSVSTLVSRAT